MPPNGRQFSNTSFEDIKHLTEGEWRLYLIGRIGEAVEGCKDYADEAVEKNNSKMYAVVVIIATVAGLVASYLGLML